MSETVFENITRPESEYLNGVLGVPVSVLDHGFIRVIDYMGDEAAIVQAARVSYGKGTKTPSDDRGLIRYLMRHRHTTPLEMVELKLHVKLPMFVARQWIRHRTANVNEYSARYSILDREFYIPAPEHLAVQSTDNKQGRGQVLDATDSAQVLQWLKEDANSAYKTYEEMIRPQDEGGIGLARELARMNLPTNIYTQWYWKVDLHNLLHFLSLRADSHAQYEIRVYAEEMCKIIAGWMPNVWEAFEDYRMQAHTFSRQEMDIIRKMISENGISRPDTFMNIREHQAFMKALGFDS